MAGYRDCLSPRDIRRVERALKSHKPAVRKVQQIAEQNEKRLTKIVKESKQLVDNKPFDVIVAKKGSDPRHLVEVKSIVRAKNNKITMHADSLRRKVEYSKRYPDAQVHTVIFDERTKKIYHRKGVGSFRLTQMKTVAEKELRELLK